jgi:DNA-binding LacI/PurR family transcriptional regulator
VSKQAVTIKDIARMLGISKSTVSRAISGQGEINPETKRKILDLAHQLDYQPNVVAVSLKQQRTNTLGVIIPETVNRFFAKAVGGIQHVANLAGFNVMICQSDESYVLEKKNVQTLLASRVDGLLVSVSRETDHYDHFTAAIQKGIPLVFFDRIVEELETSMVYSDNYEITKEATLHLIEQGCHRIAFMAGPLHLYNSRNRFRGYEDALRQAGIPLRESLVIRSDYKLTKTEEHTRYLMNLKEPPDAIFAINDYTALEVMHALKKWGVRIPTDVAVLGFNNENICHLVEPALSSIDHPAADMGAVATEVLLSQIKNETNAPVKRLVKSRLVVRASTHRIDRPT